MVAMLIPVPGPWHVVRFEWQLLLSTTGLRCCFTILREMTYGCRRRKTTSAEAYTLSCGYAA